MYKDATEAVGSHRIERLSIPKISVEKPRPFIRLVERTSMTKTANPLAPACPADRDTGEPERMKERSAEKVDKDLIKCFDHEHRIPFIGSTMLRFHRR